MNKIKVNFKNNNCEIIYKLFKHQGKNSKERDIHFENGYIKTNLTEEERNELTANVCCWFEQN